jgi:hypothetical protein
MDEIGLEDVLVTAPNLRPDITTGLQSLNIGPGAIARPSALQTGEALRQTTLPGGIGAMPSSLGPTTAGTTGGLGVTPSYSFEEKAQLVGQGVGGLGGIAMGIIGSGARKREQKAATAAYEQSLADYKNFQFENAYADIENPFEDLRVSTEAAEFQAQQQEQNLAQTLDALRSAGGGAGAASVAQALAQSQARQTQQIAADIAMDEAANEAARAGFQGKLNILEAAGAEDLEQKEYGRTFTTLGMDQQRKAAADLARQQATAKIVGGIADVGAAAASIAMGNPMGALKAVSG